MQTFDEIYLDHAASTPIHPDVLEAMIPLMKTCFGNPSSVHRFGRAAKQALTEARDSISATLGCAPGELVFTSGGTESDNFALFGAAFAAPAGRKRIVTTAVEHHAVLNACKELERNGFEVIYLPVDAYGQVSVEDAAKAITEETAVVSVMYANNEVGTLQPVEEIGRIARERGAVFHVDAVQALGSFKIDLSHSFIDLMSVTAHKINGPRGIGALYVNKRVKLAQRSFGGSQERKRRAGTENVAGAAAFAKACSIAAQHMDERRKEMEELRNAMLTTLKERLGEERVVVNGHPTERLPNILNVSFPGTNTESLLMNLDLEGIAAASGSACSSGALEPSHVLLAMNLPDERMRSAVRFSFGRGNCLNSVTFAAEKIATIVKRLTY
ncbi:cysteine desulfurase family protein [Paenibacillus thermotolerans]|uniref:cysteine desulfurase family protein n=1 Tax=Paenibacillus thermotolerans TaxID=3027807 RepID=UPI0023675B7A|nr:MULTISPECIES: cysteine desulfurase family protein [unclassified Paenibacillus]